VEATQVIAPDSHQISAAGSSKPYFSQHPEREQEIETGLANIRMIVEEMTELVKPSQQQAAELWGLNTNDKDMNDITGTHGRA
jgi:hypothetical protein